MLVFMRKQGESFYIGKDIENNIADIDSKQVKVCVNAPQNLSIIRKELIQKDIPNKTKQDIFEAIEDLKQQAVN